MYVVPLYLRYTSSQNGELQAKQQPSEQTGHPRVDMWARVTAWLVQASSTPRYRTCHSTLYPRVSCITHVQDLYSMRKLQHLSCSETTHMIPGKAGRLGTTEEEQLSVKDEASA